MHGALALANGSEIGTSYCTAVPAMHSMSPVSEFMNTAAAGATATLFSDNAGAGPARHADRVEQTAGTSNAPSGGPRLLRIPLLRPAAGRAAH